MSQPTPTETLGLLLTAIAEMIDEQHLGKDEALAKLRQMLGPAGDDLKVRAVLRRLEREKDELSFRCRVGEECLRAFKLDRHPRP